MTAHQAKVGAVVYRRTSVLRGVVTARRRVNYGLWTRLTVRWDDGAESEECPAKLRKTPPGADPNDAARTRTKEVR